MQEFSVRTHARVELIDITDEVRAAIRKENVRSGLCLVFCPHTTAGITVQENADPDVTADLVKELSKIVPFDDDYRHAEGNSAAHIKSTLVGCGKSFILNDGKPLLGTWQAVYFCEFDGPRSRRVLVKCCGS